MNRRLDARRAEALEWLGERYLCHKPLGRLIDEVHSNSDRPRAPVVRTPASACIGGDELKALLRDTDFASLEARLYASACASAPMLRRDFGPPAAAVTPGSVTYAGPDRNIGGGTGS